MKSIIVRERRARRARRTRAKIAGTADRPRLTIFRSNRAVYAQLINDEKGVTVTSASTREVAKENRGAKKTVQAYAVGKLIAEKALRMGVKKAIVDRGAYHYHGRIKALADGARSGGLHL